MHAASSTTASMLPFSTLLEQSTSLLQLQMKPSTVISDTWQVLRECGLKAQRRVHSLDQVSTPPGSCPGGRWCDRWVRRCPAWWKGPCAAAAHPSGGTAAVAALAPVQPAMPAMNTFVATRVRREMAQSTLRMCSCLDLDGCNLFHVNDWMARLGVEHCLQASRDHGAL